MKRNIILIIILIVVLAGAGLYLYASNKPAVTSVVSHDPDHATELLSWPRQPMTQAAAAKYKAATLAPQVEQALSNEEKILAGVAQDPAVVSAVRASNLYDQNNLTIEAITTLDDEWYMNHKGASIDPTIAQLSQEWDAAHQGSTTPLITQFVQQMENNLVSQKLTAMLKANPVLNKAIVADAYSLNVGFSPATSDYYQADETWWVNAFNGGAGEVDHTTIYTDQKHEVIKICVPIIDPATQRVVGIIMAQVDLTALPGLI